MASKCGYNFDITGSDYYDLGEQLGCIVKNIWGVLSVALLGVLIILISLLILKTIQNRDNSKVLPELQKNWAYLILIIIVTIGGAGTFLNILFGFLHIPGIDYWLEIVNQLFNTL